MSRWRKVRAEYRRQHANWVLNWGSPARAPTRRRLMVLAQNVVRLKHTNGMSDGSDSYHRDCRHHTSAKERMVRGDGCWCQTTREQLVVRTYDDWGDGPMCVMCGRIKEVEDE